MDVLTKEIGRVRPRGGFEATPRRGRMQPLDTDCERMHESEGALEGETENFSRHSLTA